MTIARFLKMMLGMVIGMTVLVAIFSESSHAEPSISEDSVKSAHAYHVVIAEVAERYDIEQAFIKAMIMAESGFDSKAVSKRGAIGLMQLMPETAESLGVVNGFDAEQNIDAGVRYFKQLLDRFDGELELALAAYNSGYRKVIQYQGVPPYKATKAYIRNVFTYYKWFKDRQTENGREICAVSRIDRTSFAK